MLRILALGALATFAATTAASAQQPVLDCAMFRHAWDGSWAPLAPVTFVGPNGPTTLFPSDHFRTGAVFSGVPVADALESHCW